MKWHSIIFQFTDLGQNAGIGQNIMHIPHISDRYIYFSESSEISDLVICLNDLNGKAILFTFFD